MARPKYKFRGNNAIIHQESFWKTHSEWLLSGPAETGKTISGLTFINELALSHDGAQMAILRKFRADVDGTVLLLFKQKIVGNLPLRWFGGEKPEWIGYPNKSRIWIGGIDRPGSALSGERDAVYVAQAEELAGEDWETLTTRTTGRAGVIVPGILCGDCNPLGRQHFILERARAGSLTLLPTTHRDNPSLYYEDGTLTEQGKHSMERLQALTGLRRQRLYEGLWVTPEGTIYEEFDRDIHVRSRKRDEFQWWLLSVDEGYTNPAATLVIGVDGDLRLHVFREFYERGVLPSNHAKLTNNWAIEFRTVLVIVDASAAGLIAEIADLNPNLNIQSSKGHVREGIGLVHELLKVQKDQKPRLTVDPSCVNTINEFESYLYRKGTEDPLKESDHTMDCIRNSAFFLFGGEGEFRSVSEEPSRIDTRW